MEIQLKNGDQTIKSKLQENKLEMNTILMDKVKDFRQNSNKLNYILANNSGKHLASMVKRVTKTQSISLKEEESDDVITNNDIINKRFKQFYEHLYTSEVKDDDPDSFLKSVKLQRLSDHQKEDIRKVFTTSEIEAAIKAFPEKKGPRNRWPPY